MTGRDIQSCQCGPYPHTTRTRPTDSCDGKPASQGDRQHLWPHVDHGVRTCLVTGAQAPPAPLRFEKRRSGTREVRGGVRTPWQVAGQLLPPGWILTTWYGAGPRPKVCALQQEAHRPALLPSPLHPGQPVTSASLVLWEIRLSSSLGLCPKNLRGWSGHFQSHFLSTWEQAARWAMEPRPRGCFPPPQVRLSSVRHAAPSPPVASGLAASSPHSSSQHGGLVLSSAHLSSSCAWEVGP